MSIEPYLLADQAISLLNKRAIRRFAKAKGEAARKDFDELYVIQLMKRLYESLVKDNEEIFLELAQEQYRATEPHGEETPNKEWLSALLLAYDPVTLYVYKHEVDRKRDRTAEAINSTKAKATEFNRGLMYWTRMTAQYAISVADESSLKAYEDAGIKRVKWNTQEDTLVCQTCEERDGKIYPIDKVPPKAHWGDRCWLTAVLEDK